MSKRYGRNQKRRARLEIQKLQQRARYAEIRLKEAQALGNRNQRIVEETARVLGSYFLTLDPMSVVVKSLDDITPDWRVIPERDLAPRLTEAEFLDVALDVLSLPVMQCQVALNALRDKVHIEFKYRGQHVAYAIDQRDLRDMPEDYAVERIARPVAQLLVHKLREGG